MPTSVRLISVTQPVFEVDGRVPTPEQLMVYCARVSSPQNQDQLDTSAKLLKYCIAHGHWSVFEQVDMCVEIKTTRVIAAQILRHRSFTFQEFSQRYAPVTEAPQLPRARRTGTTNRQSSTDDLDPDTQQWWNEVCGSHCAISMTLYEEALRRGVARESARFLLPLATPTTLYMKGSVRSWIHYLQLRLDPATQAEHREVAEQILAVFKQQFPITAEALGLG